MDHQHHNTTPSVTETEATNTTAEVAPETSPKAEKMLDRDRANSMADEGGVSAAHTETAEHLRHRERHAPKPWYSHWQLVAGVGVAVGAALVAIVGVVVMTRPRNA